MDVTVAEGGEGSERVGEYIDDVRLATHTVGGGGHGYHGDTMHSGLEVQFHLYVSDAGVQRRTELLTVDEDSVTADSHVSTRLRTGPTEL